MAHTRCICTQGSFEITADEVDLLERFLSAEIRQILTRQQNCNAVIKDHSMHASGSCETQPHEEVHNDPNHPDAPPSTLGSRRSGRSFTIYRFPSRSQYAKNYCADHGFEVAEVFVEPGISGKEESRPQFQRLLAEALSSDHPFNVVVVFSVSRFARDLAIGEWFIRQLAQAQVGFRAVMDGVFEGADGVPFRQMKGMVAQNLSIQNAISTSAAMNANAEAGFWNGGPPPFGYRTEVVERRGKKEKKKLVVDLVEGPIVLKIFDLALHGDGQSGPMGCKAIVDWLNARGYRTRQGNLFHVAPLYSLLHRTHYIGYYEFGRWSAQTGAIRPDDAREADYLPADRRSRYLGRGPRVDARKKCEGGTATDSICANSADGDRQMFAM